MATTPTSTPAEIDDEEYLKKINNKCKLKL
jgi:hypothetical protein